MPLVEIRIASLLASFPWYDLPSVRWANDSLWRATGYADALDRRRAVADLWFEPDLLVSQACGLDLFLSAAPIEPVAAPVFDLDCEPGMYFSYIVGNINGQVAAVNSVSSRSGWSALLSTCSPSSVLLTGSHLASLEAIRAGRADVAAIDAVTWRIIARDEPEKIAGINIVARSTDAPSPPFVVRRSADRDAVWQALQRAIGSPESNDAKAALFIKGIIPAQRDDYLPVLDEYKAVKDSIVRIGDARLELCATHPIER